MSMSLTAEDNFELWWAEYMPDATRDQAWAAYSAALAPEAEAEIASRAATPSSSGEGGKGRAPAGWQLESGSSWISIRNLASQCGQDFYKDRDPLIYGFLLALATAAPSPGPGAEPLRAAFESWAAAYRRELGFGGDPSQPLTDRELVVRNGDGTYASPALHVAWQAVQAFAAQAPEAGHEPLTEDELLSLVTHWTQRAAIHAGRAANAGEFKGEDFKRKEAEEREAAALARQRMNYWASMLAARPKASEQVQAGTNG